MALTYSNSFKLSKKLRDALREGGGGRAMVWFQSRVFPDDNGRPPSRLARRWISRPTGPLLLRYWCQQDRR